MKKGIKNVAVSVHNRLLQRAKDEGRAFNELLQLYGLKRLLYRISRSEDADRFVLKGALMLPLWGDGIARTTKDIDLHGRQTATVDEIVSVIRSSVAVDVEDDGLRFPVDEVAGDEIRLEAKYDGVRVRLRAYLGKAVIALQVDVGFGDVIKPAPSSITYPTLLDFPAPTLLGYPPETTIAEKLEAMVSLDVRNTRLKDFLDIWLLAQRREFEGARIVEAIRATFERRGTQLPTEIPVALTDGYLDLPARQRQWQAYLKKGRIEGAPDSLADVAQVIVRFLMPVVEAARGLDSLPGRWPAGGPWQAGPHGAPMALLNRF
ncbi:MAG: nucleotidyl transferase AbiEii/AbiGii toxin family protein [Polyangia bacterium]|nr:nucleotidyl transferase AbiEii/AbiGii toxin family protein [Polyangia bacterium]